MQDRIAQLAETVRFAAADRRRLCIRAGGTKDFYGNPSNGERLDPRPLCGVVDFDPAELVLTARGGTPLAEVESLLAARGQMLGFEPPHFGSGATIGGCYLLWGDPFLFWTFVATGKKTVSILRSFLHLFHAGIYGIMGMFGGWMLALPSRSRTPKILWLCWLLIFGIEVYTSGLGWHANHIGPGIVIAACWFFVALVKVWPTIDGDRKLFRNLPVFRSNLNTPARPRSCCAS